MWKAVLPQSESVWQFRELFVNGERRVRARTPNQGYYRVLKAASIAALRLRIVPVKYRRWQMTLD